MKEETRLLLRYVDREMSAAEAERFRARLVQSAELSRELRDMQELGALLRRWSTTVEPSADDLLEPTLQRVRRADRSRPRAAWLGYGLLLLPLLLLRASVSLEGAPPTPSLAHASAGAAIERLEAAQRGAQVFIVGSSATPVVWLADEDEDERDSDQDPG